MNNPINISELVFYIGYKYAFQLDAPVGLSN